MLSRRLGVAVAVLDGHLYAVGGSDGSAPLNTVERCVLCKLYALTGAVCELLTIMCMDTWPYRTCRLTPPCSGDTVV